MEKFAPSFPPTQLPLYAEEPPAPGSLNDESVIRIILTEVIRKSAKSREQIAEEMTVMVGERVSLRMLNSYTSEAAEQHRWPSQYTRAFCYVVQDWGLLRCIVERAGFRLITQEEALLLELGTELLRQKRSSEKAAILEKRLLGVEL
jgi:hypothetical protein